MMNLIRLRNTGSAKKNMYYPRLMINQHGEIILATSISKHGLTTGVLVAKTNDSHSGCEIGQMFTDWEVAGPLKDYDGRVTITLENEV